MLIKPKEQKEVEEEEIRVLKAKLKKIEEENKILKNYKNERDNLLKQIENEKEKYNNNYKLIQKLYFYVYIILELKILKC